MIGGGGHRSVGLRERRFSLGAVDTTFNPNPGPASNQHEKRSRWEYFVHYRIPTFSHSSLKSNQQPAPHASAETMFIHQSGTGIDSQDSQQLDSFDLLK